MLAITGSRTTTIALAVTVLLLFLGGAAYFMLRRPPRKGTPDIPPAMKPGPADAQLEKPRLERMQAWGIVTVVLMAIWMPGRVAPRAEAERERPAHVQRAVRRGRGRTRCS